MSDKVNDKVHNAEIAAILEAMMYEVIKSNSKIFSSADIKKVRDYIISLEGQVFGLKQKVINRNETIDKLKRGYGR